MDTILDIARRHNLYVVEDAAQAIDSYYKGRPLGSLGHFGTFSFHETKNVISGEGGMLVINDERFVARSEIIREKGTNRSAFFRGEVDKYGWVDIGSSFLPSEIIAAFLYAQLEQIDTIQKKRKMLWDSYSQRLAHLAERGLVQLPHVPEYSTNNGHMFYLVCSDPNDRDGLIAHLKQAGIMAVFHYQSLHLSPYYRDRHDGRILPNADRYSECLLRLPLFYELNFDDVNAVTEAISGYFT
jgi:dTDP-4-amino-4,6-dideoxygalactose transaminase